MTTYGTPLLRDLYRRAPLPIQNLMTSVYGFTSARRKYGRYFAEHAALLARSQYWTADQLEALQVQKLQRVLGHAAARVPYYRRLLADHGLANHRVQSIADIERLPLLDKETVRMRAPELLADEWPREEAIVVETSGTTGKALRLTQSLECYQREYAFVWQHRAWGGIRRGMRIASLLGHPVAPIDRREPPFWRHNYYEHQLLCSAYHMTPATLPLYVAAIARFRPDALHGYPSTLAVLASHMLDTSTTAIRPRAVFTASETLLDHQRRDIENAFGCRVFNWYGNSECVSNIVECELGVLHVKHEHGLLELLDDSGRPVRDGDEGEVVCTGFDNLAMPLVRYRVGDRAVARPGGCACGRGGRLIERIDGRIEDVIETPDGRKIGRIDHVFKQTLQIEEAQIVQYAPDALRLLIVTRPGFGESDEAALHAALRERVGATMRVTIERVPRLERTARGKLRAVVNLVARAQPPSPADARR